MMTLTSSAAALFFEPKLGAAAAPAGLTALVAATEVANINALHDHWNALRERSGLLDNHIAECESAWHQASAAAVPDELKLRYLNGSVVTNDGGAPAVARPGIDFSPDKVEASAAYDRWTTERSRLRAETGLDAAEEAQERHQDLVDAAFVEMTAAPATTVAALRAKAALILAHEKVAAAAAIERGEFILFGDPGDKPFISENGLFGGWRTGELVLSLIEDIGKLPG